MIFRSRIGKLWRFYRPKRLIDAIKVVNDLIEPYVERAVARTEDEIKDKETHGQRVDFTDSLSQFTKDRTVIRDQLVSTLLAGRDTTACTLSWLFYELAYHPEVYKRLREEVLSTIGKDGKPTYEDLKRMKYLQYCLNESIVSLC
jgi:cytochrome P450